MLNNTPLQTVASNATLSFAANQINSTGSITLSGNNGLSLTAGQYLVNFQSDAAVTAAGTIGASLALNGTPSATAVSSLAKTGAADNERLSLTSILNIVGTQTLTVVNSSADSNTYTNSVLTVVKLA